MRGRVEERDQNTNVMGVRERKSGRDSMRKRWTETEKGESE